MRTTACSRLWWFKHSRLPIRTPTEPVSLSKMIGWGPSIARRELGLGYMLIPWPSKTGILKLIIDFHITKIRLSLMKQAHHMQSHQQNIPPALFSASTRPRSTDTSIHIQKRITIDSTSFDQM
ncbi:uncharacterized protein A4U43_C02F630 [Asparagus officinalis]|uniref:Uncharacterized protein n=1 Tax=Asparagus officinalis TaxID=4686 RepID=A0A5P1FFH6_ASPOF|nr:uncharacterized protein A4U43_C02F630 [Asparagus officinalis]